jgi:hypothetical protein
VNNYETLLHGLRMLRSHFAVLCGDEVGPSHATWQDVAAECAATLRGMAEMLDAARNGRAGPFPVFPSFDEVVSPAKED